MKNSVKELTEGMQRLCAIANKIVAHEESVSSIERDLLLEDLRRLYDVALGLEVTGRVAEEVKEVKAPPMPDDEILSSTVMATMAAMVPEPEEAREEPAPEPEMEPEPVQIPQMEELENNDNGLLFDEVIIEEPAPVEESAPIEEPVVAEEPASVKETAPAVETASVKEAAPAVEPAPAGTQASLLDYLKRPVEEKATVRTLGEKLGGVESGEGKVESEIGGGKKVSDLRTVININDKFSFMSELFHNNMKAYNDFILRLNAIDTRDEALVCVNEVSAQYKWDEASLAVQAFYKVFDKKF